MKYLLILLLPILFLFGCAPRVQAIPYTEQLYPPTTAIEVFRTKMPQREYVELGEIWIDGTQADAVHRLVEKAKEMGADAIMLMPVVTDGYVSQDIHTGTGISVGHRSRGAFGIGFGHTTYHPRETLWAVAIKYK